MQVQIEDISPVEKKLRFEVPWDTVKAKLGDAYGELARTVSLKGFRKGKVPRSVIRQMFGRQVRAEVTDRIIRDSFVQAVTEHSLAVVSEPHVHDEPEIKAGEPLTFEAHVEVRAAIDLTADDYAGLAITRRAVPVEDGAVDAALERLQAEHTDLEPIEGRDVTASTDVLSVAVQGTIGGELVERREISVDLSAPDGGGLPGLAQALTGIPIDVTDHPVDLELPAREEDDEPPVAKLIVSIVDARKKVVPPLDDELAKDTGKAQTLTELRAVLRRDLEERAAEQTQSQLRQAALAALVARHPVPLADGLVARAAEQRLQRLKMMLGMGRDDDLAEKLGDDIVEQARTTTTEELRGELLLAAIVEREGISVDSAEIDARIAQMARQQGKAPNRLKAEMEADNRLDDLKFSLQRDRALDLLVERAVVTDAPAEDEAAAAPAADTPATGDAAE